MATALALLVAAGGELAAQERKDSIAGVWSRDFDTCSLTVDEDDARITVEGDEVRDYTETCRILSQSPRQDRSVLMLLQCPTSRGASTMRVFRKSQDSAVFYLPENKRPRSRDVIRCPQVAAAAAPVEPGPNEAWTKIREPRRLIKLWLDARQRCRSEVSVAREESCTERKQIGALLRSMSLCHFTRGSREGWRACSSRG
jgi:hypothetical protein